MKCIAREIIIIRSSFLFVFHFEVFASYSDFLTRSVRLGILLLTVVREAVVPKLLILDILFLISFILAFTVASVPNIVIQGILSQYFLC